LGTYDVVLRLDGSYISEVRAQEMAAHFRTLLATMIRPGRDWNEFQGPEK
jgi:hypothetical protein